MGGTSLCTIEQEVGATTLQPLLNSQPWVQPASSLYAKTILQIENSETYAV